MFILNLNNKIIDGKAFKNPCSSEKIHSRKQHHNDEKETRMRSFNTQPAKNIRSMPSECQQIKRMIGDLAGELINFHLVIRGDLDLPPVLLIELYHLF